MQKDYHHENKAPPAFELSLSSSTIRVFAIQILFLGLLFLPEIGSGASGPKWTEVLGGADVSRLMQTLGLILNNPAFYILLMISALIFSFSFQMKEIDTPGQTEIPTLGGTLLRALFRVLILYGGLFLVSWIFLTYKLMFMGTIYINPIVFKAF
ncbi:MAG: hypothetical protein H6862_06985 [Rhodospirillales bacterium]|nr:hypothetical protein [Rhodospirillales bacterium]